MTKAQFRREMNVWSECFFKDTCYTLQAEIVRKIMNNKAMNDFEKMTLLGQYVDNLITNECAVGMVKAFSEI